MLYRKLHNYLLNYTVIELTFSKKRIKIEKSKMSLKLRVTCGFSGKRYSTVEQKKIQPHTQLDLAGETRFEHATYGFGDRYSTVEPLP